MSVEACVISVNTRKNSIPEAVPCWPVGNVYHHFHYGQPIRLTKYQALTVQKRHRSVVPMRPQDYKRAFGKPPRMFIGRSQGIGDILMLTPALRMIAEEGWKITLAVMRQFVEIVEGNPYVERVVGCGPNEMPATKIGARVNLNHAVERVRGKDLALPRPDLFAKLLSVTVPPSKRYPARRG